MPEEKKSYFKLKGRKFLKSNIKIKNCNNRSLRERNQKMQIYEKRL